MKNKVENVHIPVLMPEVADFLLQSILPNPKTIFDGTLGGGGYTEHFVLNGHAVFACDLDQQAIERSQNRLLPKFSKQFFPSQDNFAHFITTFEDGFFDGIMLDLGFSSNQLELSGLGFSYQNLSDPLDLRFDPDSGLPCWQKIQRLHSDQELSKILYDNSGEDLSRKIAGSIFNHPNVQQKQLLTVGDVVASVEHAIPAKFKNKTNSILSRIWQALRIWTNDEFESLRTFLSHSLSKLKPGGRLAIVSFHSLEDKIVAHFMREASKPQVIDDYGNKIFYAKLLTPKAITPQAKEVEFNPRSRSALLRVLEKVKNS